MELTVRIVNIISENLHDILLIYREMGLINYQPSVTISDLYWPGWVKMTETRRDNWSASVIILGVLLVTLGRT